MRMPSFRAPALILQQMACCPWTLGRSSANNCWSRSKGNHRSFCSASVESDSLQCGVRASKQYKLWRHFAQTRPWEGRHKNSPSTYTWNGCTGNAAILGNQRHFLLFTNSIDKVRGTWRISSKASHSLQQRSISSLFLDRHSQRGAMGTSNIVDVRCGRNVFLLYLHHGSYKVQWDARISPSTRGGFCICCLFLLILCVFRDWHARSTMV